MEILAVILYDLFLVIFGIVLGVFASDPLKKLFTGKYKVEKRQKKRVKLLVSIRESGPKKNLTTEELAAKVFSTKVDVETVYELLEEIKQFGLVKEVRNRDEDWRKSKWIYLDKK